MRGGKSSDSYLFLGSGKFIKLAEICLIILVGSMQNNFSIAANQKRKLEHGLVSFGTFFVNEVLV